MKPRLQVNNFNEKEVSNIALLFRVIIVTVIVCLAAGVIALRWD